MIIPLSVDSYKGVDGSSLSPARCSQIVKVYEMLEEFGNEPITYVGIQELAESVHLFGSTAAKSAIRTFFPLLKKLDFVDYEGEFLANKCFTEIGTQFVLVCRAIENVPDDVKQRETVMDRLTHIKHSIQKQGLINMHNNPAYESHNMWIALALLHRFHVIHWNEFLYMLHCKEKGMSIEESLNEVNKVKDEIENFVFVNEKEIVLPNTCYSYIRSFLTEAGLLENLNSSISTLTGEADDFFHALNL